MALATPPKRDLSPSLFTSSAPVLIPPATVCVYDEGGGCKKKSEVLLQ